MILRTILTAFLLAALVAPAQSHDEPNLPVSEITVEQRLNAQLPLGLAFVDETGREVTLGEFFTSRPILLAFVYYECPQVCPLVLDGLVRSLRVLNLTGQDYEVVVVSIDPAETHAIAAEKKQHYLAHLKRADGPPRWHFLTGDQKAIERLTAEAGFRYTKASSDGAKSEYVHPAASLVLTPRGRISRYLYGFDYPPKDLQFALIEASGNRIGSPLDHLLLLCYQYDPAKGKYTLAVLNVLRLSGAGTVIAIAGLLIVLLRRERGKSPLREVP